MNHTPSCTEKNNKTKRKPKEKKDNKNGGAVSERAHNTPWYVCVVLCGGFAIASEVAIFVRCGQLLKD